MPKISKKLTGFVLIFGLSFGCAFIVIKIKNHYFQDGKNHKIVSAGFTEERGVLSFPEIPVPEGSKDVYVKGSDPKISGVKVLMYSCPQELAELKSFYEVKMAALGWSADNESVGILKKAMGMECLVFKNREFNCYIELESFSGMNGSALVIQLIKSVNNEL